MLRWRVLLVAACVLAAGCSTATGVWSSAPEPTRTLTPAPVPETPAISRAPVPGVSPGGSVDSRRLAAAHVAAIENRTYTWVFRMVRTDPERDERVVDATRRVQVGPTATLVEDEGFADYPPDQTVYLTDTAAYRQFRGIETSHIMNTTRADRNYVFAPSMLRFNLREDGYRLRAVERGGRRYLRLYYPPANATTTGGTPTDAYTATAIVTRAGFVRTLSVEYTDLRGHRVSLRYRYTDIGETTAPAPAWVSELRARANVTAPASATPEGSTPSPTPTPTNRSR
ncbi:MAG: hypothetical protein ABEI11_02300 [Haloarculaceae archaeon]